MKDERTYQLKGPADPHFSRVARLAISAIATEAQANIEEIDDVRLVVSEIINVALDSNAVCIDLEISPGDHSLAFHMTANGVSESVQHELSEKILDALVKEIDVTVDPGTLKITGTMSFWVNRTMLSNDRVEVPVELLVRFAESGDRHLRNEIVEQMMPFAERVAAQYANKGEQVDDLKQVALIGLIKSVERFDPDHGSDFLSFSSVTIHGELKRHFRDKTWKIHVSRRLQELHLEVRNARADLSAELNRAPLVSEIAKAINATEEDVLQAIEVEAAYRTDSLDAPVGVNSTSSRGESIGKVDDGIEKFEQADLVRKLLESLDSRDRQIVELRYFKELTQSEIAQIIDVSQMHVSRLLERVTIILRNEYKRMNPS